MLKGIRENVKYFYVLLVMIAISFVLWGVVLPPRGSAVYVAEIGDKGITIKDFRMTFERARDNLRGEQFDEEMRRELKKAVLNTLIWENVLLISARDMGLTVTDKELRNAIVNNPHFMRDGLFCSDTYFKVLSINRLTPEMFEASLRQQLLSLEMTRLIGSVVSLNHLTLKEIFGKETEITDEIKQLVLSVQRRAAMEAYISSVKQQMNIRVNMDLILPDWTG